MIYVDRWRLDKQGHLIEPPVTWQHAAEEATRRAVEEGPDHEADDRIYAHALVRAALEELFHHKCAYCETCLEETGWNVEHFRPKGRVAENKNHPGYYWLAYRWENLYPSCEPCNQRRRDRPIWGDLTFKPAGGKADQFPLEDESTRVMTPTNDPYEARRNEATLLIDPCYDTPEWYVSFNPAGRVFSIGPNPYGGASISVFNLTRRRLVRRRRIKVKETIEAVRIVRDLERNGNRARAERMRRFVEEQIAGDHACHAAVARAVIAEPERFGV